MPHSVANAEARQTPLLTIEGACVERRAGEEVTRILDIGHLELAAAEHICIAGASGAGKSTLLNLISGLLKPQAGSVSWQGQRIDQMTERARDRWRHRTIGFVFQDFHLIDELSAFQNALLPSRFNSFVLSASAIDRATAMLDRVGISDPRKVVALMSRGERQRVAIARALVSRPQLLLADEPTASLDRDNADRIAALMFQLARETGAGLIVASHDAQVLARADRCVTLAGGRIAAAAA